MGRPLLPHPAKHTRLIITSQEPKLPAIANSDEYQSLGPQGAPKSYEPSPTIPQYEHSKPSAYVAYRAPAADSAGPPDHSQTWAEESTFRQPHQHQLLAGDVAKPPYQSEQRDQLRSSQHYQGIPLYEQAPAETQQHPYRQAPPYQDPPAEAVNKSQDLKPAPDNTRRQDSIRRQGSVLRKTVQAGSSLRGHRKSQSSEVQVAAPPAPPASLQVQPTQRDGTTKAPGGMSPNPQQQPGISRSNTQMQSAQDSDSANTRTASDMSPDQVEQLVNDYRELRK